MNDIQKIRLANRFRKSVIVKSIKQLCFFCLYPFTKSIINFSALEAREILEENCPNPQSSSLHSNTICTTSDYDLTIIVPCYNAELYVKDCIESILLQDTTYIYKVLLIDDGSTDETGKIIDTFSDNENVSIIHQENKGISNARNQGLMYIASTYVMFIDSDDALTPNAIQVLLDAAYKNNADIVEGSHYRLYENTLIKSVTHENKLIQNYDNELIGMPWGKVYKSILFRNIVFPEKCSFEDSICSFLLYPQASKIVTVSDYVYVYRINIQSFTHSSSKRFRSIDTIWITELMLKEHSLLKLKEDSQYSNKIIKQMVLNYNRLKKLPEEIQVAAFVYTCDLFEKYCSNLSFEKKDVFFVNALRNYDYKKYKLFCLTRS